jgi:integrase
MGSAGRQLAWINIVENDLSIERRGDGASLKTWASMRQVPVRLEIGEALLAYEQNYRGDCCHPYFFSSREKLAIGKRTINHVFETISNCLSPAARAALERQGWKTVTPHMLRHTAVVVLLKKLKDGGETIEDAQEMLRVRFGWVKESEMPQHYGRAFFEGRLEAVVGEIFEDYVATLRKVRP